MPKAPILNQNFLFERLVKYLSQSGPSKAKDLCTFLNISQPAFSRLISQGQDSILQMGRGRQTIYALKKQGTWGEPEVPVYSFDEKGNSRRAATLIPLSPKGFYLESRVQALSTKIYESLPYLFEDLRPSGFLGRLVPRLYPDLNFPTDINAWTDDDCLLYFSRCGWDLIGNWMMGEKSYDHYLENQARRLDVVRVEDRKKMYPRIADLVLSGGIPGSSAAGEQPKFLSIRETKEGLLPVMIKFSPPVGDLISRRIADLLICEHIVHKVLKKHGKTSLKSFLIRGKGRLFLEMERFDRNISGGRRGIISMRALDLEFVGRMKSWSDTAESLRRQKKISPDAYEEILWLETFSDLIGNTDKHHGNISFFCEGEKILGLAPAYDMLPMLYAPQQNQLIARTFDPAPPKVAAISVWRSALAAARDFWSHAQRHPQISKEFKALIIENGSTLLQLSKLRL